MERIEQKRSDVYLLMGASCSLVIAILHFFMILGGAEWYRFFGAGEEFASMAENGSMYPAVVTSLLVILFGVWAVYGFSGSGLIWPLPLLKPVLIGIAGCYLFRGFLGIPVLFLVDNPYFTELAGRMFFMVVTSALCLVIGVFYALGVQRITVTSRIAG